LDLGLWIAVCRWIWAFGLPSVAWIWAFGLPCVVGIWAVGLPNVVEWRAFGLPSVFRVEGLWIAECRWDQGLWIAECRRVEGLWIAGSDISFDAVDVALSSLENITTFEPQTPATIVDNQYNHVIIIQIQDSARPPTLQTIYKENESRMCFLQFVFQ
jgi:hypothetical protein